jgi:hypothetical protein
MLIQIEARPRFKRRAAAFSAAARHPDGPYLAPKDLSEKPWL